MNSYAEEEEEEDEDEKFQMTPSNHSQLLQRRFSHVIAIFLNAYDTSIL